MILYCIRTLYLASFFFFNDTATTEIYTFPYTTLFRSPRGKRSHVQKKPRPLENQAARQGELGGSGRQSRRRRDRKSTRLNSSHSQISYAVFCLKKKKKN